MRPYLAYMAFIACEVYSFALSLRRSLKGCFILLMMCVIDVWMQSGMFFLSLMKCARTNLLAAHTTSSMWLLPWVDVGLIGPQVSELT